MCGYRCNVGMNRLLRLLALAFALTRTPRTMLLTLLLVISGIGSAGQALLVVFLVFKARITVLVLDSRNLLGILSLLVLTSVGFSFILSNDCLADINKSKIFKSYGLCDDRNLHLPFRRKSSQSN